MARGRGWDPPIALALVCLVLAIGLGLVLSMGAVPEPAGLGTATRTAPPATGADTEAVAGPAGAAVGDYAEVLERPLFHRSRRPASDEPPGAEAALVTTRPDILLRGTVVVAGGQRVALIEVASGDGLLRLFEGQALEGWTVERVERDRVVMGQRGETTEYTLDETYRAQTESAVPRRREPEAPPLRTPDPALELPHQVDP